MGNISNHFSIQELVPKGIYDTWGDQSTIFIEPRLVTLLEFVRSYFDKSITVNNWHTGGQYFESGYRTPESPTGAKLSQHKMGRAADCKFADLTPQEVYAEILQYETEFRKAGLSAMENIEYTKTWLHIDTRWLPNATKILIVNP